eukprot:m.209209 g.209209  ORF g.209209 m.209209 type:complete len:56 (+) comp24461_c0_seq1:118-285(+)
MARFNRRNMSTFIITTVMCWYAQACDHHHLHHHGTHYVQHDGVSTLSSLLSHAKR